MKGLVQLKLREFFSYFKDLDRVDNFDNDPVETRFRRLESKIDQLLNDDNRVLKDDNVILKEKVNQLLPLKDEVNELKETVKKQETEIQRLLGNQRNDKDINKQDNAAVDIATGGFYKSHEAKCDNLFIKTNLN